MPMQTHEYYEELSALLLLGQLSSEEYHELADHLRVCPSCCRATNDFSEILNKMPVTESVIDEKSLSALQDDSYRRRFLQRAIAEGVPITDAVMSPQRTTTKWNWTWAWPRFRLVPSLAAVAAIVIVVLSAQVVILSHRVAPKTENTVAAVAQTEAHPQHSQSVTPSEDPKKDDLIASLRAQIAALETQAVQQQGAIAELKTELVSSQSESASAKRDLARRSDQLAELERRAGETQQLLTSTRAELDRVRTEKDSLSADLVAQQYKINELAGEVKTKEAMAERDRQLTAAASDVREMMGARNLHILDVSDVDGAGRSKKAFGRVFLVEGKSLVFYAFDLGDRGNPAKVSFQAWGQLEGHGSGAKNLGVFYVDDHAQKRWVLKVNDPEKLKAINSVFVTVEPLGGAKRPTGRKLLYAFVGSQPNHP